MPRKILDDPFHAEQRRRMQKSRANKKAREKETCNREGNRKHVVQKEVENNA